MLSNLFWRSRDGEMWGHGVRKGMEESDAMLVSLAQKD